MLSLWILSSVVFGVNGIMKSAYFKAIEGEVCNFNSDMVKYTTMRDTSQIECAVKCFSRPDCKHSMFLSETQECYLEDEEGLVTCGSGCRRHPCFDYSEIRNVALGAVTECSTQYSTRQSCDQAVDGFTECVWASASEGVGNWIKIHLGCPRILTHSRLLQRDRILEKNKDIDMEFSDGSIQRFQLPNRDDVILVWDEIRLAPVRTTWVKITVQSVWSANNNGWTEIELFARVRKDMGATQTTVTPSDTCREYL